MSGLPRKPRSIRMRIAGGFLLLLALVFLILGVSFNRVVNSYIQTQARRQLGVATENVARDVLGGKRASPSDQKDFPGVMNRIDNSVRRTSFLTPVRSFVVDSGFSLVYPAQNDALDSDGDYEEKLEVYRALEAHGRAQALSSGEILRVSNDAHTYYVAAQPLYVNRDSGRESAASEYQLVLYMDMTDVTTLANTLNLVLMMMMLVTSLVAALIALFMSTRITRPIRELSGFARAIGRNDFTRRELNARDRELIELGDAMNRAAEQLESYDKEQKTFFQNVSHELRTPLMSIKGYAEGIKVGVFDDSTEAAGVIVSETDTLTRMVEELLYLSKMDNITLSDERQSLDIRELLSSCGEGLRGYALHEGKRVEYDFQEQPAMVLGSERSLERAFVNILANGLRYARSAVRVHCARRGGTVLIRIEDDGLGLEPSELERVFDRFYKGNEGKHGIGLSIAKAVVTQHGGTIRAENMEIGAAFVVELPGEKI